MAWVLIVCAVVGANRIDYGVSCITTPIANNSLCSSAVQDLQRDNDRERTYDRIVVRARCVQVRDGE